MTSEIHIYKANPPISHRGEVVTEIVDMVGGGQFRTCVKGVSMALVRTLGDETWKLIPGGETGSGHVIPLDKDIKIAWTKIMLLKD